MKITSKFINHYEKYDWHINLLPSINFGNQVDGSKGLIVNISWLFWF